MKAKIFCKTVAKGQQAFYLTVNGSRYFLFQQNYRVSNKEFFRNGVSINQINDYSKVHSQSVRNTLDKFPAYLRYIEKEFGIAIYEKSKTLMKGVRKQKATFNWKNYLWEVA